MDWNRGASGAVPPIDPPPPRDAWWQIALLFIEKLPPPPPLSYLFRILPYISIFYPADMIERLTIYQLNEVTGQMFPVYSWEFFSPSTGNIKQRWSFNPLVFSLLSLSLFLSISSWSKKKIQILRGKNNFCLLIKWKKNTFFSDREKDVNNGLKMRLLHLAPNTGPWGQQTTTHNSYNVPYTRILYTRPFHVFSICSRCTW